MTTNESPAAIPAALETLITIIASDDDADLNFDLIIAIADLLPPFLAADLCLAFDICPIHHTDLDSCADDDLDACADLRD
jgi:hypothetical protein